MTATLLTFADMSLQHYLKEAILPLKWVERVTNCPLLYSNTRSRYEADIVWIPNFLEEGRGWVYFDHVDPGSCVLNTVPIQEQTSRVTVYNEIGGVIDPSNYTINYKEGAIILPGGLTTPDGTPTTVDFTQYYVSLLDAWPGTDPPKLPIVAVEAGDFEKVPFQLGGGRKLQNPYKIHIFATSNAERIALTEFIYDSLYLRHVPAIDYREGEPLNYDGTFNTTYSGTVLNLDNREDALFYFMDVKAKKINGRQDWDDLNRWRSTITFTMESYREGLDFNLF